MVLLCSDFSDKRRGKIYFQKERPEVFIAKVIAKHANIVYKAVLVKSSSQSCGHTGLSHSNRRLNPFHWESESTGKQWQQLAPRVNKSKPFFQNLPETANLEGECIY